MNNAQLKCLAVFSVFAIIGFGPVSPGCLIGMYVVMFRPNWFIQLTYGLYADKPSALPESVSELQSKQSRKKCILGLLTLFILDIAPVPVTPVVAFIIILSRPTWFYRMVVAVYSSKPDGEIAYSRK